MLWSYSKKLYNADSSSMMNADFMPPEWVHLPANITERKRNRVMLNGKHPSLAVGACMVAAICALSACVAPPSVSTPSGASIYSPDRCYFPRSDPPREAPDWVCGKPVNSLQYHAFGVVEPSRDVGDDIRRAEQRARTALSRQFSIDVVSIVREFYEGAGVEANAVNAVSDAVSETVSRQTLKGVGVHGNVSDPEGRMYALVGVKNRHDHDANLQAAVVNVNKAVATVNKKVQTLGDDAAEFQLFKGQQAFDRLRETFDCLCNPKDQ